MEWTELYRRAQLKRRYEHMMEERASIPIMKRIFSFPPADPCARESVGWLDAAWCEAFNREFFGSPAGLCSGVGVDMDGEPVGACTVVIPDGDGMPVLQLWEYDGRECLNVNAVFNHLGESAVVDESSHVIEDVASIRLATGADDVLEAFHDARAVLELELGKYNDLN